MKMKKNHLSIVLIMLTFLLSACSSSTKSGEATEEHESLTSAAISYSEVIECIDDLHLLEKLNKREYLPLSKNYIYITNEFEFLKTYESIMDADSKNYLKYKLNIKMSSLCNKIKYASFIAIKEKSQLIKI